VRLNWCLDRTGVGISELAKIIREARTARAWPQEQLAEAAGVSLRTVQRVERGALPERLFGPLVDNIVVMLGLPLLAIALSAAPMFGLRWR